MGNNGEAYKVGTRIRGNKNKREQEQEGNILGQDRIGVGRSCVRMGSDITSQRFTNTKTITHYDQIHHHPTFSREGFSFTSMPYPTNIAIQR